MQRFQGTTKIVNCQYRYITQDTQILCDYLLKWREKGIDIDFDDYVGSIKNITKTTICVKLRGYQYRIATHSLITNIQLRYYNLRVNDLCTFCGKESEMVTHIFFHCEKIQPLKKFLCDKIKEDVEVKQILFNTVVTNPKRIENTLTLLL